MTGKLFILAWTLGVGPWFIAIFELISLHSFWGFAFKIGIPIKRISVTRKNTGRLLAPKIDSIVFS
jgi:hypothetical protein